MIFPSRHATGWVEVITGGMFCGKSEELIRRIKRAIIAKLNVVVFKPAKDDRYHAEDVVSHSQFRITAIPVESASDIIKNIEIGTHVVGIDEAQFFGEDLFPICEDLANKGLRVIVAGLDQDFRGVPFSPMPNLMAVAEIVTKLQAICMRCGAPATKSQRLINSKEQIVVGESDLYEARCRFCFEKPK